MPEWPNNLPSPLIEGYRETIPDNTLRSSVDQGIAKLRRRSTAAPRMLSVHYLFSSAQLEVLEGFYQDTLLSGVLRFDYQHPRSGAAVVCRFRQPPSIEAVSPAYSRVAIELEILP
jgi:hypothetical protein